MVNNLSINLRSNHFVGTQGHPYPTIIHQNMTLAAVTALLRVAAALAGVSIGHDGACEWACRFWNNFAMCKACIESYHSIIFWDTHYSKTFWYICFQTNHRMLVTAITTISPNINSWHVKQCHGYHLCQQFRASPDSAHLPMSSRRTSNLMGTGNKQMSPVVRDEENHIIVITCNI